MTALTVLHVDILLTVMFPSFYVSVSQTKLVIGLTAPVAAPGVYACWGTLGAPLTSVGARWSRSQHWGACALCMVAHSRKGVPGHQPAFFFENLLSISKSAI